MAKPKDAPKKIDQQIQLLLRSRSVFPYTGPNMVNQSTVRTAPFYRAYSFDVQLQFGIPLSLDNIRKLNELGHWINQNFIVRLHSLLESHGLSGSSSIRKGLPGNEEIDILRRLRDVFSHSDERYHAEKSKHKKLYDRIIKHFGLDHNDHPEQDKMFPIPIDKVLLPIAESCKKHAIAASLND